MLVEHGKQPETFGKCGDNLTWEYENEWLYIDGSGPMSFDQMPWEPWKDQIEGINLEGGCTSICAGAFRNCTNLEVVLAPDALEYIGEGAFENCVSLGSFIFSKNYEIAEVADRAFRNCERLDLWEADVKVIGRQVFENCPRLNLNRVRLGYENPDIVRLHCWLCGSVIDEPLDLILEEERSFGSFVCKSEKKEFFTAVISAYDRCVLWNDQVPVQGTSMKISMSFPFCCRIGDTFHALYKDTMVVTARLTSFQYLDENNAKVCIEIIEIEDILSFVRPVPDSDKVRMKEQASYDYIKSAGDLPQPYLRQVDAHTVTLYNTLGGGDVAYTDYIYTDADGIDHLFMAKCYSIHDDYACIGDTVLGFHENSPFYKKS